MKLRITREGNGLIGLYWLGQGVNELALNVTEHFGVRLRFKPTAAQNERICTSVLNYFEREARLHALTNEQLVDEVIATEAGDDELIMEMCERLHPCWYLDENTKEE